MMTLPMRAIIALMAALTMMGGAANAFTTKNPVIHQTTRTGRTSSSVVVSRSRSRSRSRSPRRFLSATTKVDGRTVEGEVKPANNFILVKIADAIERTEGGILLTGKAKLKKTEGRVVSVGPGRTHPETGAIFDMPVSPGENVVYGKYDGTQIDIDGTKHTLIRDDDILVKFTGDKLTLETADVVRDAVLVHVETKESATEGGILIAKSSKTESKPSTGRVVKVGPGRFATNGQRMEMEVAEGDMVKFRDFAGNEVDIDDEEYTVVRMSDILAKF